MNRRWNSLRSFALLAFWSVAFSGLPGFAEERLFLENPAPIVDAQTAIEHGLKLEQKRRWGDALQHYEQAIKELPNHAALEERLFFTRSHYDVSRRYSDHSYTSAIASMSERDALRIYSEVLDKIQTHYVNEPNWKQLINRGTACFDVAITEDGFIQRHLANIPAETIAQFRREFLSSAATLAPRDATHMRDCAIWAARSAQQRLNIPPAAVILEYTCGAAAALDEYSSFLTAAQLDEVFSQIEGNFVGLGVELKTESDALLVVSVINGGPAARGGLVVGDRIIEVANQRLPALKPDDAADMLRGEEGTQVRLVVRKSNGTEAALLLTRRRVEVPCVEGLRMIDEQQGIGYFKLTSFQKSTNKDIDDALWKLHRQGMKSLVIDLRGNPGGLLNAAVELADKFIMEGSIVTTRGRNPREDFAYTAHSVGTWQVPLVVLIDGDSASASEIFAGAIRDQRRGTIVGVRSYGKGSVQGIFPLASSKAGIRLTTAKFYSPSGAAISRLGVTPDVVVRSAARPIIEENGGGLLAASEDVILKAGLQVARDQLSKR